MNIANIQAALRHFAAERDWQPFHSPKNLATALVVEAAELAEIFQWMTPDESRQARDSIETKARIGDEIADVLLYLLQIADHTEVDVLQAVQGKLARNAERFPRVRTIEAQLPVVSRPSETHALLDYENVQPDEEELRALVPGVSDVWIFHGPHQKQVDARFGSFGENVTLIPISKTGRNALDFHLSYYMGYITSRNPTARVVVVANDKGYDSMLEHAKELGFAVEKRSHERRAVKVAVSTDNLDKPPPTPAARSKPAPKAPTPEVVAKKGAKKSTATKKSPARKATPPASKHLAKAAPAKQSKPAAPSKSAKASDSVTPSATLKKIVDSLRKMGDKRPTKSASLRRTVKMLLGTGASDDAASASLNNLMAKGVVSVSPTNDITYRL